MVEEQDIKAQRHKKKMEKQKEKIDANMQRLAKSAVLPFC